MEKDEPRTELKIRPYRPADRDAVLALWRDSGLDVPPHDPEVDLGNIVDGDRAALFIGEVEESANSRQMVATIVAAEDGYRGWISYTAVRPLLRGQGIGTYMLRHAEAHLSARGVNRILLLISHHTLGVERFYVRLGYGGEPCFPMGRWLANDEASDQDEASAAASDSAPPPADPRAHFTTWSWDRAAGRRRRLAVRVAAPTEPPKVDLAAMNERQVLVAVLRAAVGTRISIVKMHEFMVEILFENGLTLKYWGTGHYVYQERNTKIDLKDRAEVFRQLSLAYGQVVCGMYLSEQLELRTEFDNGFAFVVGSQAEDELPYEQLEIHYSPWGLNFVVTSKEIHYWSRY